MDRLTSCDLPAARKRYRAGVSPYGPKALVRNWTLEERQALAKEIERIVMEICERENVPWMLVYDSSYRSRRRDRVRVMVLQEVCRQTNVAPAIVARCFRCDHSTVVSALNGGRGKKSTPAPPLP